MNFQLVFSLLSVLGWIIKPVFTPLKMFWSDNAYVGFN
jgi:hypothetical protein